MSQDRAAESAIGAAGRRAYADRRAERMTPSTIADMPTKGRPKEIVRLSPETVEALAQQAESEGTDKSTIMRRAIEKELGLHVEQGEQNG